MYGSPIQVEDLINSGYKANTTYNNGLTPLMLAARKNNNPDVFNILCKNYANLNQQANNGFTALSFAIYDKRDLKIIKRLVDLGSDIDSPNFNISHSPVFIAIRYNKNIETIKYLISKINNINTIDNNGNSLLITSIIDNPDINIIKYLVNNGCNIKIKNKFNKTAYDYAKILYRKSEIQDLLLTK
jgi:Ankyrin repeat.